MNKKAVSSLEALEQRIAPASITFTSTTDANSTVKVTASKGTLADLQTLFGAVAYIGTSLDFPSLNLAGQPVFRGTDLSFELTGAATISIGDLNAAGFDLGTVIVPGEIGHLEAGDSNQATLAVKALQIGSIATHQETSVTSTIKGSIGTLQVTGDVAGTLLVTSISTATIGGNLDGTQGTAAQLGSIFATGSIGTLTVTGGLLGGLGFQSGNVISTGTISHVSVGRILGGAGPSSGDLGTSGSLPDVKILGEITGSAISTSGTFNGVVFATGKIGTLAITGKITGGYAANSGGIATVGGIDTVTVDGGVLGGHGFESGAIGSRGTVGSVTLGLSGGATDILKGGDGGKSGSILSSTLIGSVTINGHILGGAGDSSGEVASAGTITTVTVHGNVTGSDGPGSGAIGSTKALGDVTVDGDLMGGTRQGAGEIVSTTSIHSVTLHGAIIGGAGDESGAIGSFGSIGTVTIDKDIEGGAGLKSGSILSGKSITKITITQGMTGYTGEGGSLQDATIDALGTLGSVTVGGNLKGGSYPGSGSILGGTLSSVTINGNIVGGSEVDSGAVIGQKSLGAVTVHGSVKAGTAKEAGVIESFGAITSITVDGSLDGTTSGANGESAGSILAQGPGSGSHNVGKIVIKGSVLGGDTLGAGSIAVQGSIGSVTLGTLQVTSSFTPSAAVRIKGGVLVGGSQAFTGTISAQGDIIAVTVNGDVLGDAGASSGSIVSQSGRIQTIDLTNDLVGGAGDSSGSIRAGSLGAVHIQGNVIGGQQHDAGSIRAVLTDIGSVRVDGTIEVAPNSVANTYISAQRNLGSVTANAIEGRFQAGTPAATFKVFITAGGDLKATTAAQAVAIGSVTSALDVTYAVIEAGYDVNLKPVNGHVSIGKVEGGSGRNGSVGSGPAWTEVDVLAGVTGHDFSATLNAGGNARLVSTISSLIIHGQLRNDVSGLGHGIVAGHIVAISANEAPVTLQAGFPNDAIKFPSSADPSFSTIIYEVGSRRQG